MVVKVSDFFEYFLNIAEMGFLILGFEAKI